MSLQLGEGAARDMEEPPALLTFAMQRAALFRGLASILEAGGAVFVDDIFAENAFAHQRLDLPVDGRHADGLFLPREMRADIADRNMAPWNGSQIIQKRLPLFRFILHHVASATNRKSFSFYQHNPSVSMNMKNVFIFECGFVKHMLYIEEAIAQEFAGRFPA